MSTDFYQETRQMAEDFNLMDAEAEQKLRDRLSIVQSQIQGVPPVPTAFWDDESWAKWNRVQEDWRDLYQLIETALGDHKKHIRI
jgi:hypothetical protein